jgi:hypothetical protein
LGLRPHALGGEAQPYETEIGFTGEVELGDGRSRPPDPAPSSAANSSLAKSDRSRPDPRALLIEDAEGRIEPQLVTFALARCRMSVFVSRPRVERAEDYTLDMIQVIKSGFPSFS